MGPFYSTPRDFSFRCSADRSIPMNSAVLDMLPPKRHVENDYDEEYVEMIYPEGSGRRRGPPPVPPHRPSLDSSSAVMRLPFLSWMGTTIKGRAFPSIFLSILLLTSCSRFCSGFGRICWHHDVSIFRLCWNSGKLIPLTMSQIPSN